MSYLPLLPAGAIVLVVQVHARVAAVLPTAEVLVAQRMAAGHCDVVNGVRARDVGQLPPLQPTAIVVVHLYIVIFFSLTSASLGFSVERLSASEKFQDAEYQQ